MQGSLLQADIISPHVLKCLCAILLFSAIITISILSLSIWLKLVLIVVISIRFIHFGFKQLSNNGNKLRFELERWFLEYKEGYEIEYKLVQISKILNFGYTLNLRAIESSDNTYVHVWKHSLSAEFQSMLGQIHAVGLPTKR